MKETTFTKNVRKFLEDNGGGSIKLGASMFLAKGTPDKICFYKKHTFLLEDKVHPNVPSPIQKATIKKIRTEGAYAWVCTYMPDGTITLDDKSFKELKDMFDYIVEFIDADRTRT